MNIILRASNIIKMQIMLKLLAHRIRPTFSKCFFPCNEREELFLEENHSTSQAKKAHGPDIAHLHSGAHLWITVPENRSSSN